MQETDFWWYAYGFFRPGTGNLPHFGDVIMRYRELSKKTKIQLAECYGCSKRYIDMLESEANLDMPKSTSRRKFLAELLTIPPILLGLPLFTSADQQESHTGVLGFIDAQRMLIYEELLAMSWSLYYAGDFQRATKNADYWIFALEHSTNEASGLERVQLQALWCRFLQLSSTASRD
ncbi:MAG: hypothetical protein ACRDHW_01420, partial [Ktedonobacteraceae bacterium]